MGSDEQQGYVACHWVSQRHLPFPGKQCHIREANGTLSVYPWNISEHRYGRPTRETFVVVPNLQPDAEFRSTHIITAHFDSAEAQEQAEELSLRFGLVEQDRNQRWLGNDAPFEPTLNGVDVFRYHPLGNRWTHRGYISIIPGGEMRTRLLESFKHDDIVIASNCLPLVVNKNARQIEYAPPELAVLLPHHYDRDALSFQIKPDAEFKQRLIAMNSSERNRFVACSWAHMDTPEPGLTVKVDLARHVPEAWNPSDNGMRSSATRFVVVERERYQGSFCSHGHIVSAHQNYQAALNAVTDRHLDSELRKIPAWGDLKMPKRDAFIEARSETAQEASKVQIRGEEVHVFRKIGGNYEHMTTRSSNRAEAEGILKDIATKINPIVGMKRNDLYVFSNFKSFKFDGKKGMEQVPTELGKQLVEQLQQQISYGQNQARSI
ncbi:MAG: hypothetical protein KDB27_14020 [Planctomycetales bacterium]|nr:hypothetical protein [Planctomycetales bacterium]